MGLLIMLKKNGMLQKNSWLCGALFASALMMTGQATAAVVTSIRPLGFIASAIADGVTTTEVLLPDGASPHDFALRPSDIQRLRDADLVVWIGPDMEAFMTKSLTQISGNKQLAIGELAAMQPLLITGIDDDDDDQGSAAHASEHDHHHGAYNMHLWLSPAVAKVAAIAIHDKLLELMPQNKDKLDANLRQFEDRLAQTDKNLVKMLAPVHDRGYFVFHDAYSYFEKHFGLSPLGHFTVNPEIQPGAQRLHQIRTQLVEQKAVCVFAEPQFRPAVIDAVAAGTKVRSGTLDPLGVGIALGKESYGNFLTALANQYVSCLK
jgi:zinc transport system substrate-binding protein